jgi:hypothetical protein
MSTRHLLAVPVIALATLVALGCGDDGGSDESTPTATPTPTLDLISDYSPITVQANSLANAVVEGDADAIREIVPDELEGPAVDALADCVGDEAVDISAGSVSATGDAADVTVTWSITVGDRTDRAQVAWHFDRQDDGSWQLSAVPECLIRQG